MLPVDLKLSHYLNSACKDAFFFLLRKRLEVRRFLEILSSYLDNLCFVQFL